MANLNYGDFKSSNFASFKTGFEDKISKRSQLSKQDKILMGKSLTKLEKNSLKTVYRAIASKLSKSKSESYAIKRADKYISLKGQVSIATLKGNLQREGIQSGKIDRLISDLEGGIGSPEDHFNALIGEVRQATVSAALQGGVANTQQKVSAVFQGVLSHSGLEAVKAKASSAQKADLARLFQLDLVPETNPELNPVAQRLEKTFYLDRNHQNMQRIESHISPEMMPKITEQARKFPIMQAAIAEIRANFEAIDAADWSGDDRRMDAIGMNLDKQLENLTVLSEVMTEIAKDPEGAAALSSLSMLSMTNPESYKELSGAHFGEGSVQFLPDALKGNFALSPEAGKPILQAILKTVVERQKQNLPTPVTTNELAERREQSPITTRALQLHAELHQAIRQGKGWAADQASISTQGGSANDVFKLKSPEDPSKTAAFFKVGAGGEEAAGTMEKLMWNIAVVMGLEDQFVPTGETEVRDRSQLSGGGERAMQWDSRGELRQVEGAQAPRRGGVQIAQQGKVLYEHMENYTADSLDRREVASATLATLVFGMWDAHGGNIFVTEEGKIKFFDNTRSLPNSNGFISRGGERLVSSYRSSLMDLPQSKQRLSKKELAALKSEVAGYKQKVANLRQYLESPEGQSQLDKLPPGWMDLEGSLSSMEERVQLMDQALSSGTVRTLQDLAVQTNPEYKMAYALTYLDAIFREGRMEREELHSSIGYTPTVDTLSLLMNTGIDIELVQRLCQDPTISIDSLGERIFDHVIDLNSHPPTSYQLSASNQKIRALHQKQVAAAAIDTKDLPRDDSSAVVLQHNAEECGRLGVEVFQQPNFSAVQSAMIRQMGVRGQDIAVFSEGNEQKVVFKTPTGYRIHTVDLGSSQGKVKIRTGEKIVQRKMQDSGTGQMVVVDVAKPIFKEIPISDFIAGLSASEKIPQLHQLPVLDVVTTEFLCQQSPSGVLLRKSQDNQSLVIAQRTPQGVVQNKYLPGEDGKFRVMIGPQEVQMSMEELLGWLGINV